MEIDKGSQIYRNHEGDWILVETDGSKKYVFLIGNKLFLNQA